MAEISTTKVIPALLITAVLAGTVVAISDHGNHAPASEARYVDVQATGSVKIAPDAIDLPITISSTAMSNAQAVSTAATSAAKVRAALKADGVSDAYIKTTSLISNPVYAYPNNVATITGYQASQSLDITIRKADTAGTIVDDVTKAGGNNVAINGATSFIFDQSAANALAQAAAVKVARAKAQLYAGSLGVKLGDVISLTESPSSSAPMPLSFMKANAAASTQINLGVQDVSSSVEVRWSIKR
jgi:uncharacterized protein YggE